MTKLFTTLFSLAVASVTSIASAQAPAASAASAPAATPVVAAASAPAATPAKAPAPMGAKTLEAKVAMCIGCHGIPGYQASFPEVHKVPLISGQSAKYIASALNAYKAGDRKHPTMRGIATSLSDQDINDISAFYGAQANKISDKPGKEPSSEVAKLIQKNNCASCHGANLSKPIDPSYPKIAGQHADYLFVALKAYKEDTRPGVGRTNPVMGAIAKQFTHKELKALANYVSSLEGEMTVHPEPRFR